MIKSCGFFLIAAVLLASGPSNAQSIADCAGLDRIPCLWKLTCAKDPNNPNKIIPADCAQNYKEPEPPVVKVEEKPKAEPPKKTPIEQLYYFDLSELEDQKLLPDDATGEIDEESEQQLTGGKITRGKVDRGDRRRERENDDGKDSRARADTASESKASEQDDSARRLRDLIKRGEGWEEVQ